MNDKHSSDYHDYDYRPVHPEPKRGGALKVIWGIFTVLSVLANLFFILVIFGLAAAAFWGSGGGVFTEEVIQSGDHTTKIVVLNLSGIIGDEASDQMRKQLRMASEDTTVRGIVIKVNSPGGTVAASDQIHHLISDYRQKSGRPVIACMQGLATSGGYYTSVACDRIVAEPTTITGSIGVIMTNLVVKDLLEQKLGIEPVVIKSGLKKDWPSMFSMPSEEQLDYLQEKVISPAYERFVQLVDAGREELSITEVKELADGSIYPAEEALEKKLVDEIGYLDKAIDTASSLAGVTNPHVVEYEQPFSLSGLLASSGDSKLRIDRESIYEVATPQLMYLWSGN